MYARRVPQYILDAEQMLLRAEMHEDGLDCIRSWLRHPRRRPSDIDKFVLVVSRRSRRADIHVVRLLEELGYFDANLYYWALMTRSREYYRYNDPEFADAVACAHPTFLLDEFLPHIRKFAHHAGALAFFSKHFPLQTLCAAKVPFHTGANTIDDALVMLKSLRVNPVSVEAKRYLSIVACCGN